MINDDDARALWRRAAELQAIAEDRQAEHQSLVPVHDDESALTVDEIVAAAEGAGIDAEHVRIALVERSLPNAGGRTRGDWAGLLRFLADYEADTVDRSMQINAAPDDVLNSLVKLLSRQPYPLTLESTFGDDPLRDGVLVYRLSNTSRKKFQLPTGSVFERDINIADGKYFLVTVRKAEGNATRLSIRMPLFRRAENVAFFTIFAAASGWLGTTLASYIIPWTSSPSALSALIPGVVGAAGVITGAAAYRRIYRWAIHKGEAALERVLQATSLEARGAGSRNTPPAED